MDGMDGVSASAALGDGRAMMSLLRVEFKGDEIGNEVKMEYMLSGSKRSLLRKRTETLSSVMKRFKKVVGKKLGKKCKKAKTKAKSPQQGHPVDEKSDLSWTHKSSAGSVKEDSGAQLVCEALQSGDTIEIFQNENSLCAFRVVVNMPKVTLSKVGSISLVAHPLLVNIREATGIKPGECRWTWERDDGTALSAGKGDAFQEYVPTADDIGHTIECSCSFDAGNDFPQDCASVSVQFSAVKDAPACTPASLRKYKTVAPPSPSNTSNPIRVVTYNVLADGYATSKFALAVLYPYVHPELLCEGYRENLILKELVAYDGDILLLQELTHGMYEKFLVPHLSRKGYQSLYTKKSGNVNDGCACFYRASALSLEYAKGLELRHAAKSPLHRAAYDNFVDACVSRGDFGENEDGPAILWKVFNNVTTAAQVLLFRLGEDRYFVVANTHLFFHPDAPHVRLLHTNTILECADNVWKEHASSDHETGQPFPLIFAGDLNSTPETGPVEFLSTGQVYVQREEWERGAVFRWGDRTFWNNLKKDKMEQELAAKENEAASDGNPLKRQKRGNLPVLWSADRSAAAEADVSTTKWPLLRHFLPLRSVCGFPAYTNFVAGFQGTLDWIFASSNRFGVRGVLEVPSEDAVGAETALPSSVFPSDHVALVCDLQPSF